MLLRYVYIIVIISTLGISALEAKDLKGKVYGIDANQEKAKLAGVTIFWMNTSVGTFADNDGNFTIPFTDETNKLVLSMTGYAKDTITVSNTQNYIEIELTSDLTTEEINVYANKPGTILEKAELVNTSTITSKGLRKAACCNLSESFQTNPSVDVEFSDAVTGAKQIKLLGLNGTYTQLMTEKVPNMRGIASTFGLAYVPGTWMESIQISKGAASVTTGYESITGQINVEYKEPETSSPLFLNLYANDFGAYEMNFDTKYQFSEELGTILLGHGSFKNVKMDHNNDSFLDMPIGNQVNLMNRWVYHSDNIHGKFIAKAIYEDRKGGQSGFYPSENNSFYGIGIETQRYEFYGKSGYVFDTEQFSSMAIIFSGNYHDQNSFFGQRDYNAIQKSVYLNMIYETDIQWKEHDHSEHEGEEHVDTPLDKVNLGVSFQLDNYNEKFIDMGIDRNEVVPGVFAEYSFKSIKDLTLTGGFRADFHNLYGTFLTPRLHMRYEIDPVTVFRASAGKGYRVANIFSENTGLMASSRTFIIDEDLDPEEAWNYGVNFTTDLSILGMIFTVNAEFYRTDFINQVIVDVDRSASNVHFYNLDGESYSNSFQTDVSFVPFRGFDVMLAYRLNDVKMTIDGELLEKPLMSRHKGFLNLMYTTPGNGWEFDLTLEYNGEGRLPNTSTYPQEYRLGSHYEPFGQLHGQITKRFDSFDLYIGGENLTNYMQPSPVLGYDQPFGEFFDTSIVWGPIAGRKIYAGLRWNID
jgi:outer membrane receptor for ferrienterochelin and colicins